MAAASSLRTVVAVAILAVATHAQPPFNVIGEGLLTKPMTMNGRPAPGTRYAGPVVYSNEKPPMIFFPPPPKDAKPGLGGFSLFGKNKPPKSIKYVPMPHHDLPVLIYTSDKMPPIHVVQPPIESPKPFAPSFAHLRPGGSLSSAYLNSLPDKTFGRTVTTTTYQVPSVSSSSMISNVELSPSEQLSGGGLKPPSATTHNNEHSFSELETFVQAPKQIPLKTYSDMPPKASFGPSKTSSLGPASINSFASADAPRRPEQPLNPTYSSAFFPPKDNMITSASTQKASIVEPCNKQVKDDSRASGSSISPQEVVPPPDTSAFRPPETMFSFGPFSIVYGPPEEPLMSMSEPQPVGSLSSLYGAITGDHATSASSNVKTTSTAGSNVHLPLSSATSNIKAMSEADGWSPGPLPSSVLKDETWDAPMPPALPPLHPKSRPSLLHGPRPGPNPMQNSVYFPSGGPSLSPSSLFALGGSRFANLFSGFRLKRSKPRYAIAPKTMSKPPIIIYYGKKPPIHVYQKPDEDFSAFASASAPSPSFVQSVVSPSLPLQSAITDSVGKSKESVQSTSLDNPDLTYGSSQKTEVRIAAPSDSSAPAVQQAEKAAAAAPPKPVDIFPSSELQPSIYMARNSLNTILVSDLSSGGSVLKTYIVRNNENPQSASPQYQLSQQTDSVSATEQVESVQDNGSSSSGESPTIVLALGTQPEQQEAVEEFETQASEYPALPLIQSPSSFQTSVSSTENDDEKVVEASST